MHLKEKYLSLRVKESCLFLFFFFFLHVTIKAVRAALVY